MRGTVCSDGLVSIVLFEGGPEEWVHKGLARGGNVGRVEGGGVFKGCSNCCEVWVVVHGLFSTVRDLGEGQW